MFPFSLFTSLASKILAGVAIAAICFAAGGYAGYRWELGSYNSLKTQIANESIKNLQKGEELQKKLDETNKTIAVKEARTETKIVYKTKTIVKEVPIYVTKEIDRKFLMPCGLIRLRDAAILQTSPANLKASVCGRDDQASPIKASTLAQADAQLVGKYYLLETRYDALRSWAKQTMLLVNKANK